MDSGSRTTEKIVAPKGWRRLGAGWMAITARFGFAQTLVILALFYVLLIGPVALVMRRKDLLHKKQLGAATTAWNDADSTLPDLERAKRLF